MPPCKSTELKEYSAQLDESVNFLDREHWLMAGIERIVQEEISCLRVSISQEELRTIIERSKERETLLMQDVFTERAKEAGFIVYTLNDEFKSLMGKYIPEMVKLFSLRFIHKSEAESNIWILENWPWNGSMELTVKFGKKPKGDYFIRSIKIAPIEKHNPDAPGVKINSNLW
jgi:hypothetical protein